MSEGYKRIFIYFTLTPRSPSLDSALLGLICGINMPYDYYYWRNITRQKWLPLLPGIMYRMPLITCKFSGVLPLTFFAIYLNQNDLSTHPNRYSTNMQWKYSIVAAPSVINYFLSLFLLWMALEGSVLIFSLPFINDKHLCSKVPQTHSKVSFWFMSWSSSGSVLL